MSGEDIKVGIKPRGAQTAARQQAARIILAFGFAAFGLWLASGFLRAILWGGIISVAIAPIYARAVARWPEGRRLALPALVTLMIAVLFLVPLTTGIFEATKEVHQIAEWVGKARHNGIPQPAWVAQLPVGHDTVAKWWETTLSTPDAAAGTFDKVNAVAIARTRVVGADVLHRAIAFTFALVTLFFLLRDRDAIAEQARSFGHRLVGASGERVAELVLMSVRGTINGLIMVGLGEGLVMGVVYLIGGVPHPLLLGAMTAVAAAIPLGAAVVIIIAGLLLMGTGASIAAATVTVLGLVFVVVVDHTIRPALIGNATRLPFLFVLVGILGGVGSLGLLGLFVGPAVMAVLVMLWREFVENGHPDVLPPPSPGRH